MMRLHVTVEGQTEEGFVNRTLKPHLANFGVYADVRCVMTGRKGGIGYRGGMAGYPKAKNDIVRWLREDRNADVAFTTMFDYYALPNDFPGYAEAKKLRDPYKKVAAVEKALAEDMADRRFIPYIQLHEFEALLFVKPEKFGIEYFGNQQGIAKLQAIAEEFGSPELINQGSETAPSKRIIGVYPDYANNKAAIGSMIAHEIGIDEMKKACSHFNAWVTRLEQLDGGRG